MKKTSILLAFVLAIFTFNIEYTKAATTEGKITLSKTATKSDVTYGRDASVNLGIDANSFTKTDKTDIVLVIDRSTSMNDQGTYHSMVDAKNAANELIDTILRNNPEGVNMAIATYGHTYLEGYSSSSLTSNITTLKSTINSIPDDYDVSGTNIHAGLKQAYSLLKNSSATNKVIILLSDGVPNRYEGTKGVCKKAGNDECGKDVKINGKTYSGVMDVTKAYANYVKSKGMIVYSIGFNLDKMTNENNINTAKDILANVATSPANDYYYLASELNGLKVVFSNIAKRLTTVADNAVVTDIVPAGFTLDEKSIKVTTGTYTVTKDETTGRTTITWNVGKISSTENPSLTYNVLANKGHYGSMYTNFEAKLSADAVLGNPSYPSGDINLVFDMPVVPIPSVTKDDYYGDYYQGLPVEIKIDENILKNDELTTKHKDAKASVEDKIVIFTDDETNGDLKDIKFNVKDGTFIYTSNANTLGEITYKYYVISEVTIDGVKTVVKSNTSLITINIVKNPTSYVVNYLESGTNKELAEQKQVDGNVYEEVTELAIDIAGYNKVKDTEKTIVLDLDKEKNIINFYYEKRKDLSYVVNYLEKDTNNVLAPFKEVGNQTFGTKINSLDEVIKIDGYKYDSTSIDTLTINTEDNVINIYYVKAYGKVIAKYVDSVGNVLADSEEFEGMVTSEYKTSAKEINDYVLVKIDGNETGKYTEETIIVTYVYDSEYGVGEVELPMPPHTGVESNNSLLMLVIAISTIVVALLPSKKYTK